MKTWATPWLEVIMNNKWNETNVEKGFHFAGEELWKERSRDDNTSNGKATRINPSGLGSPHK